MKLNKIVRAHEKIPALYLPKEHSKITAKVLIEELELLKSYIVCKPLLKKIDKKLKKYKNLLL